MIGLNLNGTYSGAAVTLNGKTSQNGLVQRATIPTSGAATTFQINPTITMQFGALGAWIPVGGHDGFEIDQNNNVMSAGTSYFNAAGNIGLWLLGSDLGATLSYNVTSGAQEADLLLGAVPITEASRSIPLALWGT